MKVPARLACLLVCWLIWSQVALAGTAPELPVGLAVPANQVLALTLYARGVQVYEYRALPGDPTKFEWAFKAPEADLSDAQGRKVGRHFAGPTWELIEGGSVVGKLKSKADAPDGKGVPWLLLDAVQASGPILGKVVSVQRVDTVGGSAPTGSDATTRTGTESRVVYTATYKFYVAKP